MTLANLYKNVVIKKAKFLFVFLLLILITFSFFFKNFNLDASSDSLLLENDTDLKYLREVNKRYGSRDFLVLTYAPKLAFDNKETIVNLQYFKSKIEKLDWVDNVITILDIPLLKSSDELLIERVKNFKTLSHPEIDKKRAFKEIIESPIYKNFVISEDGKTSGIIVYLKRDPKLSKYIKTKDDFLNKKSEGKFNSEDKKKYKKFLKEYNQYKIFYNKKNHRNIVEIREVINKYSEGTKIHLGGIPMIADDMMSFIKNDITVFGIGVFLFIILTLWLIFKNFKWVIIPLTCCFFSVAIMIGLLGLLGWKVTVISSNFIALMLILNMAMNIHVTVRYLQIREENTNIANDENIFTACKKMYSPILYTALTTICAFLSLIFSGIRPIIDFGWMMTFGLIVSFITTFTLLPVLIKILKTDSAIIKEKSKSIITKKLGNFSKKNNFLIFSLTLVILISSVIGISKLEVENSFINYFDKKTEIYKGMKLIDDKLGGTTPLDIIIKFPTIEKSRDKNDEDKFDDWEEDNDENEKYWFTRNKIDKISSVHDYLDSIPEIGKVLSFASIIRVVEDLNDDKKLDSLEMGLLYSKIPESVKKEIVNPYISIKNNEARISVRVKDSLENLRRNELIKKIKSDLNIKLGLNQNEYKLAGVLILFNNLLQSLFKSQILTLGFVMIGIFLMFLILFRNIALALIGVVPNFLAALFILGIIGLMRIPLDMMTITIAAITIGIAVDNSIHYIYRFKEEFGKLRNYDLTINKSHGTVGIAILNTSITIIFGFSILVFSKFIPTIYFGVFTGLAMLLALISVLTLLPKLILIVKPFGNE